MNDVSTHSNSINSSSVQSTAENGGKALNIGLWVAQILLAAAFLMAGVMKVSTPIEQLAAQMPWVSGAMGGAVRFIGIVEILGALGLVLPTVTRILPKLTPLAAAGLLLTMISAALTHILRGEYSAVLPNLLLGGLATFISIGRSKLAPIVPRG